jgi:MoaD family protein
VQVRSVRVKVEAYASMREALGRQEVEVDLPDKATLHSLVKKLNNEVKKGFEGEVFDKNGRIKPGVLIFVNGKAVNPEAGDFRLKKGAKVVFMPPVEGG